MCVILLEGLENSEDETPSISSAGQGHLSSELVSQSSMSSEYCLMKARTENLRSIISITNSKTSGEILRRTGNMILPWLNGAKTELTKDESSLLYALIMKSKGEEGWYDPNNEGL